MIDVKLLIQLSENEKRLIFVILLAFIVIALIVGAIGYLIVKVMKRQGSKLETAVYDVVVTKVVIDEKAFKKYAWKKNYQLFLKQAFVPICIIVFGCLFLFVRAIVTNEWNYNPFSIDNGFASVLWVHDFDNVPTTQVFDLKIWSNWPPLLNEPHFVAEAWVSYVFVPCLVIGGVWYLIAVQALIARTFKSRSLAHSVFKKSLENYNQTRGFTDGGPQPDTTITAQNIDAIQQTQNQVANTNQNK